MPMDVCFNRALSMGKFLRIFHTDMLYQSTEPLALYSSCENG